MTFQTTNGFTVTVDDEDYPNVIRHKWTAHKPPSSRSYYVQRYGYDPVTKKGRNILLHREIHGTPPGMMTDHVDGDPLNNRRTNLRTCTNAENQRNQQVRIDSSTGYRGVSREPHSARFRAHIKIDGKKRYLGQYQTAKDAALAYDVAARDIFDGFGRLNFPELNEVPVRYTGGDVRRARTARGVTHIKRDGTWSVRFTIDGRLRQFGTFRDKQDAERVAQAKAQELGIAA